MKSIKIYDFFNHDLIIYVICFRFTINSRLNHLCYFLKSTNRRGSQIPPWFPLRKNLYLWVNSSPLKFNPNLIIVLNFSENLIIEILFFSLFFDYSGITWQRMIIKFIDVVNWYDVVPSSLAAMYFFHSSFVDYSRWFRWWLRGVIPITNLGFRINSRRWLLCCFWTEWWTMRC